MAFTWVPELRCEVTGNLCGTDTWEISYECPCQPCQQWLRLPRDPRKFQFMTGSPFDFTTPVEPDIRAILDERRSELYSDFANPSETSGEKT